MRLQPSTRCTLILCATLLLTTLPALAGDQTPLPRPPAPGSSCVASLNQLCLNAYRFAGTVTWEDDAMVSYDAKAVFINGDTGYFWFEDPRYPDAVLKVFDGCGVNNNFWVYSPGLSDRQYTLTVDDSAIGSQAQYVNTVGSYSTIADTAALTCGISAPVSSTESTGLEEGHGPVVQPVGTLIDGRFEVRVTWTDFAATTGFGTPVDLTGYSSYFWFFSGRQP